MISLSTPVFDPLGALIIYESSFSSLDHVERRVRMRPTLDGGAVANDSGHSYSDSSWEIVIDNPTQSVAEGLDRLLRLYQTLLLVTKKGAFTVVPSRFDYMNGRASLKLEILGVA